MLIDNGGANRIYINTLSSYFSDSNYPASNNTNVESFAVISGVFSVSSAGSLEDNLSNPAEYNNVD